MISNADVGWVSWSHLRAFDNHSVTQYFQHSLIVLRVISFVYVLSRELYPRHQQQTIANAGLLRKT